VRDSFVFSLVLSLSRTLVVPLLVSLTESLVLCDSFSQSLVDGALVYVRDYAKGDSAEERFKLCDTAKKVDDSLYVRRDLTLAYFFTVGRSQVLGWWM
jgi:hypothetical protein